MNMDNQQRAFAHCSKTVLRRVLAKAVYNTALNFPKGTLPEICSYTDWKKSYYRNDIELEDCSFFMSNSVNIPVPNEWGIDYLKGEIIIPVEARDLDTISLMKEPVLVINFGTTPNPHSRFHKECIREIEEKELDSEIIDECLYSHCCFLIENWKGFREGVLIEYFMGYTHEEDGIYYYPIIPTGWESVEVDEESETLTATRMDGKKFTFHTRNRIFKYIKV